MGNRFSNQSAKCDETLQYVKSDIDSYRIRLMDDRDAFKIYKAKNRVRQDEIIQKILDWNNQYQDQLLEYNRIKGTEIALTENKIGLQKQLAELNEQMSSQQLELLKYQNQKKCEVNQKQLMGLSAVSGVLIASAAIQANNLKKR